MTDMKRMRLDCGLRQIDVFVGTGIPIRTLSLAERGLMKLTRAEHAHIMSFLGRQWEFFAKTRRVSKKTTSHTSKATLLRFPPEAQ